MNDFRPLRVMMGPTAAGKSALAMQLAERYQLSIISADSRQIYSGFDIGTAKPALYERQRIPHYGIDVLAPTARYSAHQWAHDASDWMRAIASAGRQPLVVGGTGFYVRALVEPFDQSPQIETARRAALETYLNGLSGPEIERWCERLDPARSEFGKTQHRRAIETALLTGTRLSDSHRADRAFNANPVPVRYLVVDPGPVLAQRIETRVQAMLDAGWVDEVRMLMGRVPLDAPAWKASGYAVLRDAVAGTIPLSRALQRIVIETRQYAKRQRTWNRHQLPAPLVTVVDASQTDAFDRVCAWWETDDWSVA